MSRFTSDDRRILEFGINHNLGMRYSEAVMNLLADYGSAREDTARLDWLEANGWFTSNSSLSKTVRDAIDFSRKGGAE